jgi:hypothetical protein
MTRHASDVESQVDQGQLANPGAEQSSCSSLLIEHMPLRVKKNKAPVPVQLLLRLCLLSEPRDAVRNVTSILHRFISWGKATHGLTSGDVVHTRRVLVTVLWFSDG